MASGGPADTRNNAPARSHSFYSSSWPRSADCTFASGETHPSGSRAIHFSILAEFTLLWCDLEDSRPHKLRRYGALNPQAEEMLGSSIQRLIELVLAVSEVARGK